MTSSSNSFELDRGSAVFRATVREAGEGTPIVFLHAGVADSRMWASSMEQAGWARRLVAYDRRGFGASRWGREPFDHAGDLEDVMTALGIDRAILAGCSQGGRIAIDLALDRPDRVAGLILVTPAVSGAAWPTEFEPSLQAIVSAYEEADESGDPVRLNEIEARVWLDGPLATAGRVTGAARELFLEMNRIVIEHDAERPLGPEPAARSALDRLGEIAAPTLVIAGELDFPHITERARLLADEIRGSQQVTMRGVAHLPPLEAPTAWRSIVRDFVHAIGA